MDELKNELNKIILNSAFNSGLNDKVKSLIDSTLKRYVYMKKISSYHILYNDVITISVKIQNRIEKIELRIGI